MSRRTDPSPIQLELLGLIVQYRDAHGISPTFRELAQLAGRATSTIGVHITRLRELDLVSSEGGWHRCAVPTAAGLAYVRAQWPSQLRPHERGADMRRKVDPAT